VKRNPNPILPPKERLARNERLTRVLTPDENIAKRIIVPSTGLDLSPELQRVWLQAVQAALALARRPLELEAADPKRPAAPERLAALAVLWNTGADSTAKWFRYAIELGRLPQTQKLYDKLRECLTPAVRVLIAYANLLCREKQVPTVKGIQDEIIRDGKDRGERYTVLGHSGVRLILSRAKLPMTKPGWPRKKRY
jgi:hypothetical protein